MAQQNESKIGGFLKGALSFGALAATCVGLGAIAIAAWPIITTSGIGALFSAGAWSWAGVTGTGGVIGVLPTLTAAFTGIGGLIAGGAALFGGSTSVAGSVMRERQANAHFQSELQRAQAMNAPNLGHDRSVQPDYAAMGEAAGINYDSNWQGRTGRGQGAGQSTGVAQPTQECKTSQPK